MNIYIDVVCKPSSILVSGSSLHFFLFLALGLGTL